MSPCKKVSDPKLPPSPLRTCEITMENENGNENDLVMTLGAGDISDLVVPIKRILN